MEKKSKYDFTNSAYAQKKMLSLIKYHIHSIVGLHGLQMSEHVSYTPFYSKPRLINILMGKIIFPIIEL